MKAENIGTPFDNWLQAEGIYEETTTRAIKRVLARQLEAAMKQRNLTKTEVARRMNTSRAVVNRLLDPDNDSLTLTTLQKAAAVVGRQVRLELV